MGLTKRSDLVVPEILVPAIQAEFAGMRVLLGTGAAVVNGSLPEASRGGDTVKVPYFDSLGEMDDVTTEGDALTPMTLAMSSETASVRHSGKAVEISYWAQLAAKYADPYKELARQFRVISERRVDKALIDAATASLPSDYVHDVYSAGTPKTLDYDVMIDGAHLWGDEQSDIVMLIVHSKVMKDLWQLKLTTGEHVLTAPGAGMPTMIRGIPIVVSDRATKTADSPAKYESLIVKRGALAFWYQDQPRVRTDSDALADTDLAAIHMYYAAHRYKRAPGATKPGVIKIVTN